MHSANARGYCRGGAECVFVFDVIRSLRNNPFAVCPIVRTAAATFSINREMNAHARTKRELRRIGAADVEMLRSGPSAG